MGKSRPRPQAGAGKAGTARTVRDEPPRIAPLQRPATVAAPLPKALVIAAPWLIAVAGAGLRFYRLDREPFWFDEAYTALSVQLPMHGILERLRGEGNAPLYYLLMHAWSGLFGDGVYSFRFVSALLGALTIPLTYWVGTRMFSRRAALIAATLAAVSPLHIHYAQEARMYPLVPPFALAALYMLNRLLVAPSAASMVGLAVALLGTVHTILLPVLPAAGGRCAVGARPLAESAVHRRCAGAGGARLRTLDSVVHRSSE